MSRRKHPMPQAPIINQHGVKLGFILESKGNRQPFTIYRSWGDYINRDYKNLRKELLAEDVPWNKVNEAIQQLKDLGR